MPLSPAVLIPLGRALQIGGADHDLDRYWYNQRSLPERGTRLSSQIDQHKV
jgi:hypothetical protein